MTMPPRPSTTQERDPLNGRPRLDPPAFSIGLSGYGQEGLEHPYPAGTDASTIDVDSAIATAIAVWIDGEFEEQVAREMAGRAVRLADRLAVVGRSKITDVTEADCWSFICAPKRTGEAPSNATQRNRRSTIRAVYGALHVCGVVIVDPTTHIDLDARPYTAARPLSDMEIQLARTVARRSEAFDLKRAAAWALAEAGAISSEIAQVRIGHLDDPADPGFVDLAGNRYFAPRRVELTEWGSKILAARVAELVTRNPTTPLVYGGTKSTTSRAAQSAVCNLIGAVLDECGLGDDPHVRPLSVRHWRGRALYEESNDIFAVAAFFGTTKLDKTADAIGLHRDDA